MHQSISFYDKKMDICIKHNQVNTEASGRRYWLVCIASSETKEKSHARLRWSTTGNGSGIMVKNSGIMENFEQSLDIFRYLTSYISDKTSTTLTNMGEFGNQLTFHMQTCWTTHSPRNDVESNWGEPWRWRIYNGIENAARSECNDEWLFMDSMNRWIPLGKFA